MLFHKHKQKFIQHGFTDLAPLEYVDEYLLSKKIGIDDKSFWNIAHK